MSILTESAGRHLMALGFTEIEAAAYTFLVRESPATGYRVAQAVGRTAANCYKALESLEQRGAVVAEDGEVRNYRAVPPQELLRGMASAFAKHHDSVSRLLERVHSESSDDRVYQLRAPEQVYERCRTILDEARYIVLIDTFSAPLAVLSDHVERAVARGVKVAVMVYEPTILPGAEVVLNHQASVVRGRWSGQWINLAADSKEQLHALMSPDGTEVFHATWSASAFLAHLYQSGLLGEMSASVVRNAIKSKASRAEIVRRLEVLDAFEHAKTPAFATLTSPSRRPARPRSH